MTRNWIKCAGLLASAAVIAAGAAPAFAQAPAVPPAAAPPGDSVAVALVRLLVAQGTITRDKGDTLIADAQRAAAQDQARLAQATPPAADAPAAPPGTIRVPYVPVSVRNQIKDELRTEVMQQAKSEGWAAPGTGAPDWTKRVRLYGDVRVRSQSNFYSATNSNQIPNFQAIAAGGPRDIFNDPIPFLNTTQDRTNQLRFRARLGADVTLDPHVKLGIELATGDDPSPLSTNASLGGGFAKRNIYLYKAFIEVAPTPWTKVDLGRFANPFTSTDLLFDPDLNFDGVAANVNLGHFFGDKFDLNVRGGAFPLDFGDQNFPDDSLNKSKVPQKYLFSAQVDAHVKLPYNMDFRVAAAYHNFVNVQAHESEPCLLYAGATQCSSDGRSAFFVRKGNTLFPIRNIALNPNQPAGSVQAQPQLLGLSLDYDVIDLMTSIRIPISETIHATATADYIRNLAFRKSKVCRYGTAGQPLNNGGADGNGSICDGNPANRTSFVGGNQGYQVMLSVGYDHPKKWGEWRVYGGYKYLQSDATLDSFTDDDFHLGGTNAKGYILGGELGLYPGTSLGARWLSANEITGEPLSIDVLQVDLNASF